VEKVHLYTNRERESKGKVISHLVHVESVAYIEHTIAASAVSTNTTNNNGSAAMVQTTWLQHTHP
jgi:hypothetical protein